MYGNRINQIDFRVAKTLRYRRVRTLVALDIYNALNSSAVLTYNNTFVPGGPWLQPLTIMTPRFLKLAAEIDFYVRPCNVTGRRSTDRSACRTAARTMAVVRLADSLYCRPRRTAQSEQRSVLALYAQRRENPVPVVVDPLLQRILAQRLPGVDYYNEFIDAARFADPEFQHALRDFLKRKYAGRRFDVVIAASSQALDFVKANRDELFAGVPVVFHDLERRVERVRRSARAAFDRSDVERWTWREPSRW